MGVGPQLQNKNFVTLPNCSHKLAHRLRKSSMYVNILIALSFPIQTERNEIWPRS